MAARWLALLAPSLPEPVVASVHGLIRAIAELAVSPVEERLAVATEYLVNPVDAGQRRSNVLRMALSSAEALAEHDQRTDLHHRHFLERYLVRLWEECSFSRGALRVRARALADVAARTPHLTTLVNNAGIQRLLDFTAAAPPGPADIAPEIATNLTGLINVTAAALPLLRRAPRSRVVHVGSGLGFVPYAKAPVYSATKAAVHSFTVSLRRQLAGSTVQVVEIIPPVVDTPLHRDMPAAPPMAMPLGRFLDRAMRGLDVGKEEIPIGLGRLSQIGARVAPKPLLSLHRGD